MAKTIGDPTEGPSTPLIRDTDKIDKQTIAGLDIESLADMDTTFAKVLFYGKPGAGKTRLAASASAVVDMSPVLLVDVEGGTLSIKDVYPQVEVVRIRDKIGTTGKVVKTAWEYIAELYEELRKGVKYKTIIIDSLTEVERLAMYYVMRSVANANPDRDIDVPAQRDWGKTGEMTKRMVRAFRDLDCHVIFTALDKNITDNNGNVVEVVPALPGKLAYGVAGFVDIVGYLYTDLKKTKDEEGVTRRLLTEATRKHIAKDRTGKLPMVVENPTMETIMQAIGGSK